MPNQFELKVKAATDTELKNMLSNAAHDSPDWRCIRDEITIRSLTKQNWYNKPVGLIGVGVIIVIIGALALYLIRQHTGILIN